MTIGELAEMFNTENKIGVKLRVVRMEGYERSDWFDETGLSWISPSPNCGHSRKQSFTPEWRWSKEPTLV